MEPVNMDIPEERVLDLGKRVVKLDPSQFSDTIRAFESYRDFWDTVANEPWSDTHQNDISDVLETQIRRVARNMVQRIDRDITHYHQSAFEGEELNLLTSQLIEHGGDENGNISLQTVFNLIKELRGA